MNPRVFKIANFFAFNLLFFALYLNFVHKDKDVQQAITGSLQTPVATHVLPVNAMEQVVEKNEISKNSVSENENNKELKQGVN